MAYTWNRNGGVRLSGKLTLGGTNPFKLMSAGDLAWDGVQMKDGTPINNSDDLLDYIDNVKDVLGERIDNVSSSNAGYEVRCDVSICYEGDTLNHVPVKIYKDGEEVSDVGPNSSVTSIRLSNNNTAPTGSTNIMSFDSERLYNLYGTVNKPGTYVFNFVKGYGTADEIVVASFSLNVLMKNYKSTTITVYKSSATLPNKPEGISYNFSNSTISLGNSGWSSSTSGLSNPIWFCSGYVNESNSSSVVWNEPCLYIDSEIVNTENEYRVKEVAVYKACLGPHMVSGHEVEETPATPTVVTSGGVKTPRYKFDLNPANEEFIYASGWGWYETPQAAVDAYKNDPNTLDEYKSNYIIWKSYNSYRITVNKLTNPNTLITSSYSESGWTSPVKYMDIDGILKTARTQANEIFDNAIENAKVDLLGAEDLVVISDAVNVVFSWRVIGSGSSTLASISSKYTELADDADTTSEQHMLFDRFNSKCLVSSEYVGNLETMNNDPTLCVPGYQMKAVKFDHISDKPASSGGTDLGSKWVAYMPSLIELRDQISALDYETGALRTAVDSMNPDEIRLQVSKGFMKDVTWTEVDEDEWDSKSPDPSAPNPDWDVDYVANNPSADLEALGINEDDLIRHSRATNNNNPSVSPTWTPNIVTLRTGTSPNYKYDYLYNLPKYKYDSTYNPGGFRYGHYYKVTGTQSTPIIKYFRCDYPIQTGFMNVLADRVSFGVTNNLSDQNATKKGSLINMTIDGVGITGDKIVLDGDTIADAIYGKSLNINNTTYLNTDGSVFFGVPNSTAIANPSTSSVLPTATGGVKKSSRFNTDGSGELCGGNINWDNNGRLYVKEAYIGDGNVWKIETRNNLPIIYSKDSVSPYQELYITPEFIRSCQYANRDNYDLDEWRIERNGTAYFAKNNAIFRTDGGFKLGGSGTHEIDGEDLIDGKIDYNASDGRLTISGENINITANAATQIGTALSDITISNDGVGINGTLSTKDVSIGDGAAFFKGTNTALSSAVSGVSYDANTRGAGHVAKGHIKWDASGNTYVDGNITADSMKINAVSSYRNAADLGDGKMWFTNYESAKSISHGVIQNASVTLENSDPVILFKSVRNGVTSFFVLNPLLLGNGSTTRTTQIGFLDESRNPSSIRNIINSKILKRYLLDNEITKVEHTSSNITTVKYEIQSYSYLYMYRFVECNCCYKDDSYNLIHHTTDGSEDIRSAYDRVIEITRFYIDGDNDEHIAYDSVYLYPAYAGNGVTETRMYSGSQSNVGYYVSTSMSVLPSGTTETFYDLASGTSKTYTLPRNAYVMEKTNKSGYPSLIYVDSTNLDYDDLLNESDLRNDNNCIVYSDMTKLIGDERGYADNQTTNNFTFNCYSNLNSNLT